MPKLYIEKLCRIHASPCKPVSSNTSLCFSGPFPIYDNQQLYRIIFQDSVMFRWIEMALNFQFLYLHLAVMMMVMYTAISSKTDILLCFDISLCECLTRSLQQMKPERTLITNSKWMISGFLNQSDVSFLYRVHFFIISSWKV